MSYDSVRASGITSLDRIRAAYEEQSAGLDPLVTNTSVQDLGLVYAPHSTLKAIAYCGRKLRRAPGEALATKAIGIPDDIKDDPVGSALIEVINASVEPVNGVEGRTFNCRGGLGSGACSYAEDAFAGVIANLLKKREGGELEEGKGVQVFVDDEGLPVLLRKFDGETTALALETVVISGIPYPKGSILRVGADTSQDQFGGSLSAVEVYPTSKLGIVAFSRLSGFALPEPLRHRYFTECDGTVVGGRDMFTMRFEEVVELTTDLVSAS